MKYKPNDQIIVIAPSLKYIQGTVIKQIDESVVALNLEGREMPLYFGPNDICLLTEAYHELPPGSSAPFSDNNPWGVLIEGHADNPGDLRYVTDKRIEALDQVGPQLCSFAADYMGKTVVASIRDCMLPIAQLRDNGIYFITRVPMIVTVEEYNLWANLINLYLAKTNNQEN